MSCPLLQQPSSPQFLAKASPLDLPDPQALESVGRRIILHSPHRSPSSHPSPLALDLIPSSRVTIEGQRPDDRSPSQPASPSPRPLPR